MILLQGHYGPFQPNIPIDVPLWLGLALHKRRKCRIQPPEWLHPDKLQGIGSMLGRLEKICRWYCAIAKIVCSRTWVPKTQCDLRLQEIIEE